MKVARTPNSLGRACMHPNDGRVVSNFIVPALGGGTDLQRRRRRRGFGLRAAPPPRNGLEQTIGYFKQLSDKIECASS